MIQLLKEGRTLLVDGPACIHLLSGKASVLGAPVKAGEKLIVRGGKRMPFEALCNAEIELVMGESASFMEINGDAIPPSWRGAVKEILSVGEAKSVLVIGGTDSGKTSFCTYLANMALNTGCKVAIIDGDLGQSDIGPPGTVGLALIVEPVIDLFRLQAEDVVFIGVTSPSGKVDLMLNAMSTLKNKALELGECFLVINTDGWIQGGDAVNYKARLVSLLVPDIVVAIQSGDELSQILAALKNVKIMTIESPGAVKKRDRETRKALRESAYKKCLREAKVRSYPLSRVKIEGDLKIYAPPEFQRKEMVDKTLETAPTRYEEESGHFLLVLGEGTEEIGSDLERRVITLRKGDEKGLLVALESAYGNILGIGVLSGIDLKRGVINVYTPVSQAVSKIRVGQIKLDREGNEIDLSQMFSKS